MGGSVGKVVGKVANVASLGLVPKNVLTPPKLPSGSQPIPQTQQEVVDQFRAGQALRNVPRANAGDANLSFGEWEAMKRANDRPGGQGESSIPVIGNRPGVAANLASANAKYDKLADAIAGPQAGRPEAYLPGMPKPGGKGQTTLPAGPSLPILQPSQTSPLIVRSPQPAVQAKPLVLGRRSAIFNKQGRR